MYSRIGDFLLEKDDPLLDLFPSGVRVSSHRTLRRTRIPKDIPSQYYTESELVALRRPRSPAQRERLRQFGVHWDVPDRSFDFVGPHSWNGDSFWALMK